MNRNNVMVISGKTVIRGFATVAEATAALAWVGVGYDRSTLRIEDWSEFTTESVARDERIAEQACRAALDKFSGCNVCR